MGLDVERLKGCVRDVAHFPVHGVSFKDITPLLADVAAFGSVIDALAEHVQSVDGPIDRVVGIESRGFIVAAPLAYRVGAAFVPVRKPGKLPSATVGVDYDLEYGTDRLEMHADALAPGDRVLVVDDVLATGGTAAATAELVEQLDAEVAGFAFVLELGSLGGRDRLVGHDVMALVRYE